VTTCAAHGAIVVFAEHGIGMCYGCVRALKQRLEDCDAESARIIAERLAALVENPTPYEEHRGHREPREWCFYCKRETPA
jgi:hypothetical protein